MADVVAMPAPAAPAAAPAASPSPAAAPAASTTTPAAPAAGSTPATTSAPSSPAGGASDIGGGAAAGAAGSGTVDVAPVAVEPVAPKPSDFGSDVDGNAEYLAAKFAWDAEHGGLGQQEEDTGKAGMITGAEPNLVQAAGEGDGESAAVGESEPALLADAPAPVTPEALAGWAEKSPELKAAMEADPELKEAMYGMARTNALAAPLLEIFPDAESAQFANQTAGQFVELRAGFEMAAEDPAAFPDAFAKFEDLFRLKDENGKYVKDAAGNIVVGEDFNQLANHMVTGFHAGEIKTYEGQIAALEEKLSGAIYPNAQAKAADETALQRAEMAVAAYRFIEGLKEGEGEAKPDLSKIADPEVRAYYERKEAELEEQRKALGQQKTDGAKTARQAERTKYETEFRGKFGGNVGKRINDLIKQKLDAGTFIPAYVLEDKDPKSGVPTLALKLLNDLEKKINGIPSVRAHMAKLQMMKPSAQAMQARVDYHNKLVEDFLPGLVDAQVKAVQGKERADRAARAEAAGKRGEVAQIEPRSGASPRPTVLTDAELAAQAKATVAKLPGYVSMEPREVMQAELAEKYRLRGAASVR